MNIIDRLERKFPRFGIPHLMKYVIIINIAGALFGLMDANGVFGRPIYASYLSLDFNAIFHGQVWRLITFVLYPVRDLSQGSMFINVIWFAIWAYLYYFLGTMLEKWWGTFRFNLFYLGGILFVVLTTLAFYLVNCGIYGWEQGPLLGYMIGYSVTFEYLNETVFLAFALLQPDAQFLLYFVIPFKAKWMAWISIGLLAFNFIIYIMHGQYYGVTLIVGAVLNFLLFFFLGRGKPSVHAQHTQRKRQQEFRRRTRPLEPTPGGGGIHRCAICGRTEKDDPRLEFRYCTKCNGDYEYCSDHLFTHTHVN
ncbi:MAG: hypothetical protein IKQ97_03635 [Eubacterium sp.]|nr:hypothetical protein [Eubacterium sp.]